MGCRIIGSFLFFHPLFSLAVKELRRSREEGEEKWAVQLALTKEPDLRWKEAGNASREAIHRRAA